MERYRGCFDIFCWNNRLSATHNLLCPFRSKYYHPESAVYPFFVDNNGHGYYIHTVHPPLLVMKLCSTHSGSTLSILILAEFITVLSLSKAASKLSLIMR